MRQNICYKIALMTLTAWYAAQNEQTFAASATTIARNMQELTDLVVLPEKKVSMDDVKARIRKKNPSAMLREKSTHVQMKSELSYGEQKFHKHRKAVIERALRTRFGIAQPLKIAICASSGGLVATLNLLGCLQAAEASGVLDSTLYLAGSSGSAWLITAWSFLFLHNHINQTTKASLIDMQKAFEKTLQNPTADTAQLSSSLKIDDELTHDFMQNIVKRFGYDQPLSILDVYGQLIGNFALQPAKLGRLEYVWSTVADKTTKGKTPLPLCAAAMLTDTFEVTPFDCGCKQLGYIQVQHLGSRFQDGFLYPKNCCPEYSLTFFLGLYGARFAQDLSDLYLQLSDKFAQDPYVTALGQRVTLPVKKWIEVLTKQQQSSTKPQAYFHNYARSVAKSSMKDQAFIPLTDASYLAHFPTELLYQRPRPVDIIIFVDAQAPEQKTFTQLSEFFTRKNSTIKDFANLDMHKIAQSTMTIFNDPASSQYNPQAPTCIYLPTLNLNQSTAPYVASNFTFTPAETELVIKSARAQFIQNVPEMVKTFEKVGAKKYPHITEKAKKAQRSTPRYMKNSKKKNRGNAQDLLEKA